MDSTHGITKYNVKLTTIEVRKPNDQYLNVAFCLSKDGKQATMVKFFKAILPEKNFNTELFMSDMANSYYSAWVKYFGMPGQSRICEWHV